MQMIAMVPVLANSLTLAVHECKVPGDAYRRAVVGSRAKTLAGASGTELRILRMQMKPVNACLPVCLYMLSRCEWCLLRLIFGRVLVYIRGVDTEAEWSLDS